MQNLIRRAASAIAWRIRCWWAALGAVRHSRAVLDAGAPAKLVVVCYGNIYRSPYAARLLGDRLGPAFQVRSTGFHAAADRPSLPAHVEMSLKSGVDLRAHRSTIITLDDIQWADAIVLMDRHNWQALRQRGADPARLIWLGAFDGGGEIPDPYGLSSDDALRIMHRVHRCTEALATAILARRTSPAS
jgi:protein-tyrosine phosphatase